MNIEGDAMPGAPVLAVCLFCGRVARWMAFAPAPTVDVAAQTAHYKPKTIVPLCRDCYPPFVEVACELAGFELATHIARDVWPGSTGQPCGLCGKASRWLVRSAFVHASAAAAAADAWVRLCSLCYPKVADALPLLGLTFVGYRLGTVAELDRLMTECFARYEAMVQGVIEEAETVIREALRGAE